MGRPLAVVAAGLTLFAGVNLVLSANRTLSGSEPPTIPASAVAAVTVPSSPPATVPAATVPTTVAATSAPSPPSPPSTQLDATATTEPAAADAPAPVVPGPPPPGFTVATAVAETASPPVFLAATVPTRGIGCAAEPFVTAFARSGFTPSEVNVGSCEIVLDIPGRTPGEQVCAQVSGPPAARAIHVAQRTIDGGCRRDPLGVTIHEIGHAWHLADPVRYYRVLATFGLDPRADASLEVVAECFVEAVGYLDTECGPQGAEYIRTEIAGGRQAR